MASTWPGPCCSPCGPGRAEAGLSLAGSQGLQVATLPTHHMSYIQELPSATQ